MRVHHKLSSRMRIPCLIVIAVFLGGLAHGWLHSAFEFDGASHFADAEVCFLGAPLATAPWVDKIRVPDWPHARASLHPAQTPRASFSAHFPAARAPPLV